jgi:hypothetical protein
MTEPDALKNLLWKQYPEEFTREQIIESTKSIKPDPFNYSEINPKCETLLVCRERFLLVLISIYCEIFM